MNYTGTGTPLDGSSNGITVTDLNDSNTDYAFAIKVINATDTSQYIYWWLSDGNDQNATVA